MRDRGRVIHLGGFLSQGILKKEGPVNIREAREALGQGAKIGANPGYGEVPYLGAQLRIDCFCQPEDTQIQGKIRYIKKVAILAECGTGGKKQPAGQAICVDSLEIP